MGRKKGKNGAFALKLDMSKAYEKVEWPFLKFVLSKFGFNQDIIDLIMAGVATTLFSIMFNGALKRIFQTFTRD